MRAWLPHLLLGLILAGELTVARARHQTVAELETQAHSNDVQARLDALHVLANRGARGQGDPGEAERETKFGIQLAKELYRSDDDRLREFAFSTDVCKFEPPLWQEMMVEQRIPSQGPTAHWWRCYVILKRKVGGQIVGGSMRLRMKELRWFFDALRGEAPDQQAALEHLLALQRELQERRGL